MASPLFGFTQLEYGFLLGPGDGRYMVREESRPEAARLIGLGEY